MFFLNWTFILNWYALVYGGNTNCTAGKKKGTNNEFKLLVFVSKCVYTNILDQFLNTWNRWENKRRHLSSTESLLKMFVGTWTVIFLMVLRLKIAPLWMRNKGFKRLKDLFQSKRLNRIWVEIPVLLFPGL